MLPIRPSHVLLATALAACAAAPGARYGHPGEPNAAQRAQLKAAEQAYRAEARAADAKVAAEALAKDPKAVKVDEKAAPGANPNASAVPKDAGGQPSPTKPPESGAAPVAPQEDFAALRDALAKDPVTAFWLTRLFIRDLLLVREARQESEEAHAVAAKEVRSVIRADDGGPVDAKLLQSVAKARDPLEVRALAQIDAMGEIGRAHV